MSFWKKKKPKKKPAAKPKTKGKPQTALVAPRPVPKFEPKPFTPPKMPETGYAVCMSKEKIEIRRGTGGLVSPYH